MTYEEGKTSDNKAKPKVRVIAPIEGLEKKTKMAPTRISAVPSRTCAYHQNIPAVYICAKCSNPLCMSCALPYGNLFLCPQCYEIPKSAQTGQETKESPKPPLESILGLFGGIIILVGFFMPWVTSEFTSPRGEHYDDAVISGFTIARDYAEVSVVFIMGILIIITELLLMALITSPMMVKEPPIGVRLLPMFLGFVAYVILAEIVLRAESFTASIHIGWFVCVFGASVVLLAGVIDIWKYYKGTQV
jgi:hypothetical protein